MSKIGTVIAEYAGLELRMYMVYALISQDSGFECFKQFYRLRQANLRKELVLNEAKKQGMDSLRFKALEKTLAPLLCRRRQAN